MAPVNDPAPISPRRWPWFGLLLTIFGVLFYVLQPILLPFMLGALMGYLGDPLVDELERRGMGRSLGVSLVFLLFTLLLIVGLLIAIPALVQQIDEFLRRLPAIYRWVTETFLPALQARFNLPEAKFPSVDWSAQLADNWASLGRAMAQALRNISGSGISVLGTVFNLALVPVVAFYLMRDWDLMMSKLLHMLPRAWQENTASMVGEADEVLGAFIRGQLLVMLSLGIIYSIGLWLVGVQFALVLGMVAGLASIVPYLGFIVGISSSLIVAYAQFQDWTALLLVALVFGVGQALESIVLTPVLVGDRIGLHPVAVIFVLMAGWQLAGFVGVLAALPVSAVIMVFLRHAVAYYRSSDLYHGD